MNVLFTSFLTGVLVTEWDKTAYLHCYLLHKALLKSNCKSTTRTAKAAEKDVLYANWCVLSALDFYQFVQSEVKKYS